MERIRELSRKKINSISLAFSRYLADEIDWSERMTGISGARGSGKTTLLLQKAHALAKEGKKVIYVSVDDFFFTTNRLILFAEEFEKYGGEVLFLDEVHKYPDWSRELKNIYDNVPRLKVVFTSSSALELYKGKYDLSRRAVMHELAGLSFREYLELKHRISLPPLKLGNILENAPELTAGILKQIKPLPLFEDFLRQGYYPFFTESAKNYSEKLQSITALVIETDLPSIYNIDYQSVVKLKRLVSIAGTLVPFTPNIEKLSRQVNTTRDSLLRYLFLLEKSHILRWLSKDAGGINYMNKPDKLYLHNTNLAFSLSGNSPDAGNLRETLFLNQVAAKHKVSIPDRGDFLVDKRWTFEVGGKNKQRKQISNLKNAFVVRENIEYAFDNVLPLWIFGMLY